MNLNLCRIVLRPRGPLESFDLAVRLIRVHLAVFARLAAWTILPLALLTSLGVVLTRGQDGQWAWALVPLALSPLLHLPFTLLAGRLLFADDVTVRQVLGELARRPAAVVSVVGWSWAMVCAGLVPAGVGLLVTVPFLAFLGEAGLLERVGLGRVHTRAIRLAGLGPGAALAAAFSWLGLTAWGAVVGEAVGHAVVEFLLQGGRPFGSWWDGELTPYVIVGMFAVQPLHAAHKLLLFVDVRTRVDGWDLQVGLRAARLAAESEGRSAGAG